MLIWTCYIHYCACGTEETFLPDFCEMRTVLQNYTYIFGIILSWLLPFVFWSPKERCQIWHVHPRRLCHDTASAPRHRISTMPALQTEESWNKKILKYEFLFISRCLSWWNYFTFQLFQWKRILQWVELNLCMRAIIYNIHTTICSWLISLYRYLIWSWQFEHHLKMTSCTN